MYMWFLFFLFLLLLLLWMNHISLCSPQCVHVTNWSTLVWKSANRWNPTLSFSQPSSLTVYKDGRHILLLHKNEAKTLHEADISKSGWAGGVTWWNCSFDALEPELTHLTKRWKEMRMKTCVDQTLGPWILSEISIIWTSWFCCWILFSLLLRSEWCWWLVMVMNMQRGREFDILPKQSVEEECSSCC